MYDDNLSVYYAIAKRGITKKILRVKDVVTENTRIVSHFEFMYRGVIQNFDIQIESKEDLNKGLRNFIRKTIERYPENNLLKLYLAGHYVKYNGYFLKAYELLSQVRDGSHTLQELLSMYILVYKLEKILLIKYKESTATEEDQSNLNMLTYIKMSEIDRTLRAKFLKQNKLQIDFWEIWLSSEPNYKRMYNIASKIHKRKKKNFKLWRKIKPELD